MIKYGSFVVVRYDKGYEGDEDVTVCVTSLPEYPTNALYKGIDLDGGKRQFLAQNIVRVIEE